MRYWSSFERERERLEERKKRGMGKRKRRGERLRERERFIIRTGSHSSKICRWQAGDPREPVI